MKSVKMRLQFYFRSIWNFKKCVFIFGAKNTMSLCTVTSRNIHKIMCVNVPRSCMSEQALASPTPSNNRFVFCYTCTVTCHISVPTQIIYYIFHIKPHFFKSISWSHFWSDFDDIYTNNLRICCYLYMWHNNN